MGSQDLGALAGHISRGSHGFPFSPQGLEQEPLGLGAGPGGLGLLGGWGRTGQDTLGTTALLLH